MRSFSETPIVRDNRDRALVKRGVAQFVLDPSKSLRADPSHEGVRFGYEQLMQVADRETDSLRDEVGVQAGITQVAQSEFLDSSPVMIIAAPWRLALEIGAEGDR